jgi:hypothetical protein
VGRCKAGSYILIFTPWACFFPGRLPVLSPFVSGSHAAFLRRRCILHSGRPGNLAAVLRNKRSPEDIIFHSCRPRYHSRGGGYSLLFFHIPIHFILYHARPCNSFPTVTPSGVFPGAFFVWRGRERPAGSCLRSCRDLHAASVLP